ncbi:hypothetical protein NTGBS_340008 [Candidatus Nitrotoga sp. BS]|uniref:hypothetical protein n=1 Tax=Candidatus Nitrotoga sp. BS TaxID=2890408 RepID=UPI001EF35F7F|nr:hypothetical protein [Candidatus Nitrotoga sp. BS]CAH1198690.1 hypothetical protein NTGBS_340008 [Candidatus Nitrotoga sp. BS]
MQNGLFDLQNRYASLSEAGDPLERLNAVIARWAKKSGQSHYGYKNPINIDQDTKLITAAA